MMRTIALTLTSFWLGCGASPPPTGQGAAFNDDERTVEGPGGMATVGLRVVLGGDGSLASRTHLEAVLINIDGEEIITDLGEFDGLPVETAARAEEVGRLHLQEGDTIHELVLRQHASGDLELHFDGEAVRRVPLNGSTVEAQQPFLLRPPTP